MQHQEIAVARFFADQVDQAQRFLIAAGIGVKEDRAVLEPLGGGDVQIGHVAPVQFALVSFICSHCP